MHRNHIKNEKSTNFILWVSFCVFALIIVVVFGLIQIYTVRQTYRRQIVTSVTSVANEVVDTLDHTEVFSYEWLNKFLYYKVNSETITVCCLLNEDGKVFCPIVDENEIPDYSSLMPMIRKNSQGLTVYEQSGDTYAFSKQYEINQETYYLYIVGTMTLGNSVITQAALIMVYIGALVIIAATLLSGFISLQITKPITDLTEKAKRLGNGSFNIDFTLKNGTVSKEIQDLSDTLNYAEEELSKADQMQKELIANVSHDFKTPLTMIKAYASMIQEISGDNPEKRKKHTQVIIDESDRLASLVNDMLELSKLRAGLNTLKTSVFNLSEYIYNIASKFEYLEETQNYHLDIDVVDNLYTEADKEKIGQVIYNLIGNAVNYTGEDKKIIIRLYAENGMIHFTVSDTGVGIPPEEINTIWNRYYRSAETHKRPVKGTGLGLSIVKTILDKHKFPFGVRSEVGKGSTFYVDFPQKTVQEVDTEDI